MRRLFRKATEVNWKYVFGELLLIVSGILIALYISDLNEAKKTRDFEKQILTEIEKSLGRDLEFHIKNRLERAERIIHSTEVILRFLDQKIAYHDSLEIHFWALSKVILFEPQTIPFERLRAKGIESLSNEKIRVQLLDLYDYRYPRISYLIEKYNNWTIDRTEPFCLQNFEIRSLKGEKGYRPIDIQSLITSMKYRNLVVEKQTKTLRLITHLNRVQEHGETVLQVLRE